MRAFIISFFVSFAAVGVLGGALYGEKEDAIAAVEKKFEEVIEFTKVLYKHVVEEREKTETLAKNKAAEEITEQRKKSLHEFASEITATTRTAIAKGKPLTTIDCIMKVALEGHDLIMATEESLKKTLDSILATKQDVLKMAEFEINLIGIAMKGLKEESVEKIKEAPAGGIQALKADALKKLDSAYKQFSEIERRVPKPVLLEEYLALKKQAEVKNKEVKESLYKRLQKCL